jgi:hypothetical protein
MYYVYAFYNWCFLFEHEGLFILFNQNRRNLVRESSSVGECRTADMFLVILIQIIMNMRFGLSCWLVHVSYPRENELNVVLLWLVTHVSMEHSTVK